MADLRMPSIANLVLSGRLTADPKLTYTPGGTAVCRFRLANDQRRGEKRETLFLTCVVWGKTAEIAADHLAKGAPVIVTGTLETRTWTRQDGTEAVDLEVNVNQFQGLEWKDKGQADAGGTARHAAPPQQQDDQVGDDLPF